MDSEDDESIADFTDFAEDLIGRYLKGEISFTQFVDADSQPSTSAYGHEPIVVDMENVTIGNDVPLEHSYVGPFKIVKNVKPKSSSKRVKEPNEDLDEELLSSKTSELVAQMKEAYGRKQKAAEENAYLERNIAEELFKYEDDENDEDYVPEEIKAKKSRTPKAATKKKFVSSDTEKKRKRVLFSDDESPAKEHAVVKGARRKLPEELQSLLGQANLCFAQGRTEEAMQMVHEVVKQRANASEPYDILATFYDQLGDPQKYLQFALLAAHLDNHCDADRWSHLAQLALDQGKREQAIACFTKAYKADPTNRELYEAKLKLLEEEDLPRWSRKILATKQHAVQGLVDLKTQPLNEFLDFALKVFEESYAINDSRGAILCLRCCLKKAFEHDVILYKELNHCLELLLFRKSYDEALRLVFSYSKLVAFNEDIAVADDSSIPEFHGINRFDVPDDFPLDIEAKAICCFIYLHHFEGAKVLFSHFENCSKISSNVDLFLDIADAWMDSSQYEDAEAALVSVIQMPNLPTAAVWLCYAEVLSSLGRLDAACKAYHNVVELAPQHINARLSLAALQQQLGLSEEALQTLEITDNETLLDLDERLLYQKCFLLEQQNDMSTYCKCARQFLAMIFKEVQNIVPQNTDITTKDRGRLSVFLRVTFSETVKNSQLNRLVKKVPHADPNTSIKAEEIWNVFYKLCEKYYNEKRYQDLLHLCCYGYLSPSLLSGSVGYVDQIYAMLLFSSVKTKNAQVLYQILRYSGIPEDRNSYYNMLGLLFMFSQEVTYQRYILRQMLFRSDNIAFSWFSGNNSLLSGVYHHALAEYVSILPKLKDSPLLNLLIAISFVSLSTRKDINRRHDICIQGLCFLDKYKKLRGNCQETFYNMGRAMHQLGLLYAAVEYYEKVLNLDTPVSNDDGTPSELFDLKSLAAHNLSLIYYSSNNKTMARYYLEKYCTV